VEGVDVLVAVRADWRGELPRGHDEAHYLIGAVAERAVGRFELGRARKLKGDGKLLLCGRRRGIGRCRDATAAICRPNRVVVAVPLRFPAVPVAGPALVGAALARQTYARDALLFHRGWHGGRKIRSRR
jgi:hypothetical protein